MTVTSCFFSAEVLDVYFESIYFSPLRVPNLDSHYQCYTSLNLTPFGSRLYTRKRRGYRKGWVQVYDNWEILHIKNTAEP